MKLKILNDTLISFNKSFFLKKLLKFVSNDTKILNDTLILNETKNSK